jgi:hypothetical protein
LFLIVFFICIICIELVAFMFPSSKEGMGSTDTNKVYTYYPDKMNPNLKKNVRINYLIKETTDMLVFLKNRQKLVFVPPPEPEDPPEPADEPYVDNEPSLESSVAESQTPAPATTTTPTTTTTTPAPSEPVKESLESMSPEEEAEYNKKPDQLDLHKKYETFRNANTLTSEMEKVFGEMFNSEKLKHDEETIYKKFITNIEYYNTAYNLTKYFVIQPITDTRFDKKWFSLYIAALVRKHKNDQTALDEIKTSFYKMIDSTFSFNKLCSYFKENSKIYNTKDDALYLINTAINHLKQLNYTELLSNNNTNVYFIESDKNDAKNDVILLDALKYTDIACIMYDLMVVVSKRSSPHLAFTFSEFKTSYKTFVEENKIDSFYLFLMNNQPEMKLLYPKK